VDVDHRQGQGKPGKSRQALLTTVHVAVVPSDIEWMSRALALARQAQSADEVPVGAVVVLDGNCIGEGWNAPVGSNDPTAHAEIRALRTACLKAGNYRLPGAILYSTLEPCPMCAGAMVQARILRLHFAAPDPKAGAAGSVFNLLDGSALNHAVEIASGLLQEESAVLLQEFFRARR
jgi:tRNA(adenine34) deaminase